MPLSTPLADLLKAKPHAYAWEKDYRTRGKLWRPNHSTLALRRSEETVLDAGCGDGKTLVPLVRDGFRVTGVDVSPTALRHCREKLNKEGLKAELVEADATKLPFRDAQFDVVLSIHFLDHLLASERKQAAGELVRVLKTGGRLVFQGFAKGDFREGKGKLVEADSYRRGNNILYHYFTAEEVSNLFESFGLTVVFVKLEKKSAPFRGVEYPRRKVAAVFVKNPKKDYC